MNVLITGGTGFIGSRLALKCLEQNNSVKVFAQANNAMEQENLEYLKNHGARVVTGSMTDREEVFKAAKDIDIIYHLAAAQHEANISDQIFENVNVTGTKNILDAGVENKAARFIHGSTIGVYGDMNGIIDEDTPCNPDNIYGKTKLAGEKLVLSYAKKIPVVIIRIPETYGPGDRRLLKLFRAIKKNMFFMIGSGENLHHLIFIDDLIKCFLKVAEHENALNDCFIIAGKLAISTKEMVKTIADELNANMLKMSFPMWPFFILAIIMEKTMGPLGIQPPIHRRRLDFFKKSYSFALEKAEARLNFHAEHSFQQGVAKTIHWYEKHNML